VPGQPRNLYRPLTSMSFFVDGTLSGMRPAWFHGVNTVLHALATLLVTLLALELSGGRRSVGWVAGSLFAVHPIHVEAVAGIVGRSEILAALGALGAILSHRRALGAARGPAPPWTRAASGAGLRGIPPHASALLT